MTSCVRRDGSGGPGCASIRQVRRSRRSFWKWMRSWLRIARHFGVLPQSWHYRKVRSRSSASGQRRVEPMLMASVRPVEKRRQQLEECKLAEAKACIELKEASAAVLEVECQVHRVQNSLDRHGTTKLPKPVANHSKHDLHHLEQKEQERLEWELGWEAHRKLQRFLLGLKVEHHTLKSEELQAKHAVEEARLLYFNEIQLALADERELRERNERLELSVHLAQCRIDELERAPNARATRRSGADFSKRPRQHGAQTMPPAPPAPCMTCVDRCRRHRRRRRQRPLPPPKGSAAFANSQRNAAVLHASQRGPLGRRKSKHRALCAPRAVF